MKPGTIVSEGTDVKTVVQNQPIIMADYVSQSYESFIDGELKKSTRKQVPLAIMQPVSLFKGAAKEFEKGEHVDLEGGHNYDGSRPSPAKCFVGRYFGY